MLSPSENACPVQAEDKSVCFFSVFTNNSAANELLKADRGQSSKIYVCKSEYTPATERWIGECDQPFNSKSRFLACSLPFSQQMCQHFAGDWC